jgi:hypothetical protein
LGFKCVCIQNTNLEKTLLPDWCIQPQFSSRPEGETAFHKLDRAFDRHVGIDREQQVKMVGHNDECMEAKFPSGPIVLEGLDE